MGAARKRRLALIKAGRPEVARTQYYKPIRLITETFLATPELDAAITERFELANKATCPTRAAFLEKLVIGGMASFDRYVKATKPDLIATPTPEQVIELG